ncbi:TniQ family protein [Ectothiorhodospiraceae bacterium WFHF3C12]|nr:TniQ family protein [Ectothiorhodospiraceae bacterium WFHF3C12]
MTPSPLLPRTPGPQPREHFLGYALRLANTNGYRGYWPIKDLIGLKGMTAMSAIRSWLAGTLDFGPLGAATNRPKADLAMLLKAGFEHSHEHYRTTRPRLCPNCLAEEPFIREGWDFTPVTHCARHRTVLIDQCPNCDRPLTWARPHVHYCGCGFDLRSASAEPVDAASASLLRRSGLAVSGFASREHRDHHGEGLAILESFVRRLYRPNDVMEASPDLNSLPNRLLHPLYLTAAQLNTDARLRAGWASGRKDALRQRFPSIGPTLSPEAGSAAEKHSATPGGSVSRHLSGCGPTEASRVETCHSELTERQRFGVTKLRLKCAKRQQQKREGAIQATELNEALSRQIDLLTLSKALAVSPSHLHSLREWNLLFPVHQGTPRYEEWLFDLSHVDHLLATLPANAGSPRTTTTVTIANILEQDLLDRHNCSLGRLLKAVFNEELAVFRTGVGAFDCLAIDKEAIEAWLIEQLETPKESYTMSELRDLLNVPGPVVSHLCYQGFLPIDDPVRRAKQAFRIAAHHVDAFRARYVLLNSLARASGRHLRRLREPLTASGIVPRFEERSSTGQAILIYDRAPALIQALRAIVDSQTPEIARHLAPYTRVGTAQRL